MTGRPRVNLKAFRIVANPYFGILYDDQLWSPEEWYRQERLRNQWRRYKSSRATEPAQGGTE